MIATILNYDNLRPWITIFLCLYAVAALFIKGRLWYYRREGRRLQRELERHD